VHHPTGDSLAVHGVTVTRRRRSFRGDGLTIQFVRVSCIAQCLGWSGPVLRETGNSRSPGTSTPRPGLRPAAVALRAAQTDGLPLAWTAVPRSLRRFRWWPRPMISC
jgi:hypothetical protein